MFSFVPSGNSLDLIRTPEGLLELLTLNSILPRSLLSELKRYKDAVSVRCTAIGIEVSLKTTSINSHRVFVKKHMFLK